jgi:PAS domain S-box-containing protein
MHHQGRCPLSNPLPENNTPGLLETWPGAGDDLRPISAIFASDALARVSPKGEIIWANDMFWQFFERERPQRRRQKLAALIGRTGAQKFIAELNNNVGSPAPEPIATPSIARDGASILLSWEFCDDGQGEGLLVRVREDARTTPEAQILHGLSKVVMESQPGVLLVGADQKIKWLNPAFTELTGYTATDALGKRPAELLDHEDSDPRTLADIGKVVERGGEITCDILNRRKDGSSMWFDLQISPLYDAFGKLSGYFSIQTDVTHRLARQKSLQTANEAAEKARTQLVAAVNALQDGLAIFDANNRLVLCNNRYKEFFAEAAPVLTPGAAMENVFAYVAEHVEAIVDPSARDTWVRARMDEFVRNSDTNETSLWGDRWVRSVNSRMRDGGTVGLCIDVTVEMQNGQALEDAHAKIMELKNLILAADKTSISAQQASQAKDQRETGAQSR